MKGLWEYSWESTLLNKFINDLTLQTSLKFNALKMNLNFKFIFLKYTNNE